MEGSIKEGGKFGGEVEADRRKFRLELATPDFWGFMSVP